VGCVELDYSLFHGGDGKKMPVAERGQECVPPS
jgi:hypothetical protein